jgi:hypothetical protein
MPFFNCIKSRNKVDPNETKVPSGGKNNGGIKSNIECDTDDNTAYDSDDAENENYRKRWARQMTEEYYLEDQDYPSEKYDEDFKDDVVNSNGLIEITKTATAILLNGDPIVQSPEVTTNDEQDTRETGNEETKESKDKRTHEIETLMDVMESGLKLRPSDHCLGERDPLQNYSRVKWFTYTEIVQKIKWFASGLLSIGLDHGQETRVAIYASNSPRVI